MILISLVLSFEFYCISIHFHCISTIISIVFPLYFHCISIVFYPFLLVHDHDLQCATSLIYPEAQFQGETILDAAKRFIKLPHFEEEILREKIRKKSKKSSEEIQKKSGENNIGIQLLDAAKHFIKSAHFLYF